MLRKLLEDTGRFEVRVTEEFRGAGPETLAPYDLVVLNYYDGRKPALRWGDRADQALLEFVRSGKGVVVYHFSVAAFDGWTEFEKMSAGNWRPNNGHHSARHDFKVDITRLRASDYARLKKSFPQPNDELYANLKWQPEGTFPSSSPPPGTIIRFVRRESASTYSGSRVWISRCCGPWTTERAGFSLPR